MIVSNVFAVRFLESENINAMMCWQRVGDGEHVMLTKVVGRMAS